MIGKDQLALMRPTAILVNTSRGRLVDEVALFESLGSGRLAAAGVDVFEHEPPAGTPLLELPNVVLSPHIAGIGAAAQQAMLEAAVASVLAVLAGEAPAGVVNPEALARTVNATRG
jgi:phosphogluconate 2-dehydrogenase